MRTVLLVALLLVSAVPFVAQNSSSTNQRAVEQVLENQLQAWNRGDLEGFMSGYWNSSQLTFFSAGEVASGWQQTINRYRKRYQSEGHEMGKLSFSDSHVELLGTDNAFVRGAWKVTMSDGKTLHGLFTLIFQKFSDGWKIIHDHTSAAE